MKKPYSIDVYLWGISIESGKLEDPNYEPDEDVYQLTKAVDKAGAKAVYAEVEIKSGIPVRLNGNANHPKGNFQSEATSR